MIREEDIEREDSGSSQAADLPSRVYGGAYCAATNCHNCQYREGPKGIKFYRKRARN
jgi:hypothetical protein